MKLTIEVKQSHIDNGLPRDTINCPIALALRGNMGFRDRFRVFNVGLFSIYSGSPSTIEGSGTVIAQLPKSAQKFIGNFDHGLAVKPFSFQIEVN